MFGLFTLTSVAYDFTPYGGLEQSI